jgi:hypothetical protein
MLPEEKEEGVATARRAVNSFGIWGRALAATASKTTASMVEFFMIV